MSWSHGRGDGEGIPRSQAVETIRSIVETVDIPVTAEIEGGYGTASDVRETVRMVLDAGVVGINLEDSPGLGREALLPPEVQAERIREAREAGLIAGVEVFINARIDEYLLNHGESSGLCERVLRRAAGYGSLSAFYERFKHSTGFTPKVFAQGESGSKMKSRQLPK